MTDRNHHGNPPEDLTDAILEATCGPTCGSARERLCDWVDSLLGEVDEELVELHARSCRECAELAGALRAMSRDLPELAEIDPGPAFTRSVLEATQRYRPVPLAARIAESIQALMRRPRFAWEGAFIGSFALVLLFGTPSSPFAGVPQQALALAALNPVEEIRDEIGEPVAGIEAALSEEVKSVWISASGRVASTSKTVAGKIRGSFTGILHAFTPGPATEDSTEPDDSSSRLSDDEDTERDDSNARSRNDQDRPDGDNR